MRGVIACLPYAPSRRGELIDKTRAWVTRGAWRRRPLPVKRTRRHVSTGCPAHVAFHLSSASGSWACISGEGSRSTHRTLAHVSIWRFIVVTGQGGADSFAWLYRALARQCCNRGLPMFPKSNTQAFGRGLGCKLCSNSCFITA